MVIKIYHPNVGLEGNVCLDTLREDWEPVLNLTSVMVGLQYLFLEPNADDPLNKGRKEDMLVCAVLIADERAEVAEELRKNRDTFIAQGKNYHGCCLKTLR
jgi:ubiquitin-conjugating enzyme E2 M